MIIRAANVPRLSNHYTDNHSKYSLDTFNMNAFTVALIPIMVLIFLGYVLKRANFIAQQSWVGMEKLTYYILFPSLLIHTLSNQTLVGTPWPSMLAVITGTLLISSFALVIFYKIKLSISYATFTSIFQGGIRFNTYIAFAVAQALYGFKGLALSSVVVGFMIVLINFLCISVFAIEGKTSIKGIISFTRSLIVNPLIVACAIGWFLSLSGIGLSGVPEDVLKIIGGAALPFGLLAAGAGLKPELIRGHFSSIAISSVFQFCLKPLSAVMLISYTGLSGIAAAVLIIAFMVPTSPASYILARQLGGDTETMASIITFQTIIAFLFMPLIGIILLK